MLFFCRAIEPFHHQFDERFLEMPGFQTAGVCRAFQRSVKRLRRECLGVQLPPLVGRGGLGFSRVALPAG